MKRFLPLLVLLPLAGCGPKGSSGDDLQFAKTTFTSLANGDTAVASSINFDKLSMMGMNVGDMYSKMPSEAEKTAFRNSFISSYSTSFKSTGATANLFGNWRIHKSTPPTTVVATDGKNGSLYITVLQENGTQKVTGLSPKAP
jgi:hypothetical protein